MRFDNIGARFDDDAFRVIFKISYHPEALPTDDYIYIKLYFLDGSGIYRVYKMYVAGMDSAVAYLAQYQ